MTATREAAPPVAHLPAGLAVQDRPRHDPLRAECAAFGRYLTGAEPDAYVVRKYLEAHRHLGVLRCEDDAMERAILGLARRGGLLTEAADAYARVFRKGGVLRSKLMVLLAIVESSPPTHRDLNSAVVGSRMMVIVQLIGWILRGVSTALLGVLLLGPLHLATAVLSPFRRFPHERSPR